MRKGGLPRTCRMASLCISPVHAGIMFLSTANSSFILLRRLLSIRLWAVFLAILRPAALVALGCFFLPLSVAAPEPADLPALAAPLAPDFPESLAEGDSAASSWARGFIWIIFLDLVGGGGRANDVSLVSLAVEDLRRDLTVSAACNGYGPWGELKGGGA